MKRLLQAVAFVAVLFVLALGHEAGATATRKTIGPGVVHPTNTPQTYATRTPVLAQPSAQPTCGVKQAQTYADPNGCIYNCADQRITTVTRSLNVGCVFPTTTATP